MITNLLILLLASYAEPVQANSDRANTGVEPVPAETDIVVTGKKVEKREILGSRVPRKVEPDPRGFVSQIASNTGVAGLTPGSGMDPFTGATRTVTVTNCKASDPRIALAAACDLALAQKLIQAGDLGAARGAIFRALENPKSGPADKFFAHRFSYQIAMIENDSQDRTDALNGMLETGLLSPPDRVLARKTLASLAMARGDGAAAISELERVVAEAPNEATGQANLGVLYAQAGLHARARTHIEIAVRLTSAAAETVPQSWIDYLKVPRPGS